MRIGELAKSAGVGVETVRYYQRIGLLPTPNRPYASFRSYTQSDVAQLRFVKRAQQLGFSLDEIAELLRLSSANCEDVQALAKNKLRLVRDKIADLDRMASVLESVLERCARRKAHEGCPIIETLADRSGRS